MSTVPADPVTKPKNKHTARNTPPRRAPRHARATFEHASDVRAVQQARREQGDEPPQLWEDVKRELGLASIRDTSTKKRR